MFPSESILFNDFAAKATAPAENHAYIEDITDNSLWIHWSLVIAKK